MSLGQIGCVGGEAVCDDSRLDVVAVREPEMLLGRHVAEHGAAEPADHGRADAGRDVVVSGRDVGGERAKV